MRGNCNPTTRMIRMSAAAAAAASLLLTMIRAAPSPSSSRPRASSASAFAFALAPPPPPPPPPPPHAIVDVAGSAPSSPLPGGVAFVAAVVGTAFLPRPRSERLPRRRHDDDLRDRGDLDDGHRPTEDRGIPAEGRGASEVNRCRQGAQPPTAWTVPRGGGGR